MVKKTKIENFDKEAIKKILVTRMQSIGDVICFIPTLRNLRENFPHAEITLLTGRTLGRDTIRGCPFVDKILFYDIDRKGAYLEKFQLSMSLRRNKFDLVIASSQEVGFALKAFLSGARYRIGFKEGVSCSIKSKDRFGFLNTVSLMYKKGEHEVDANLRLLKALGLKIKDKSLKPWINDEGILFANEIFKKYHLRDKVVVAVNPSSRNRIRNWPVENYAELLKYLLKRYDLKVILISGKQHRALNEKLAALVERDLINLAGRTTVEQLIALLSMCNLFIGNDSGPTHIVAALNIPTVALYGPANEVRFRPYSENCIVINKGVDCAPCDQQNCSSAKCMKSITSEEVIKAVEYFLNRMPKEIGNK